MAAYSSEAASKGRGLTFVPTMGGLHEGHLKLTQEGRRLSADGDLLVVSIFLNPTQFGPSEDFSKYPKNDKEDLAKLEEAGVDLVFMPTVTDIYPKGFKTYVEVEGLSDKLCGQSRPGHFRGVATVVARLFGIVKPRRAVFGLKDYQQFVIIKKMTEDLMLGLDIFGFKTVREADGLAMSSRNAYLTEKERAVAGLLSKALLAGEKIFRRGSTSAKEILLGAEKIIEKESLVMVDYLKLCDPSSLEDLSVVTDRAVLLIAVRIGKARLIDNCILERRP